MDIATTVSELMGIEMAAFRPPNEIYSMKVHWGITKRMATIKPINVATRSHVKVTRENNRTTRRRKSF